MPFKPGEGGRPAGSVNKVTQSMREAFKAAFDERGGVPALLEWAEANPTPFYQLVGRLIPVEVTGEDGGALVITVRREG